MNVKWTNKITNEELWRITKQKPIEIQIKRRKWNWIGHTLSKEAEATEKTTLDWNTQGYRGRGRPKRTWQRIIKDEIRSTGKSWNEVKGIAGDRNAWKLLMDALCSTRNKRIWWWWVMPNRNMWGDKVGKGRRKREAQSMRLVPVSWHISETYKSQAQCPQQYLEVANHCTVSDVFHRWMSHSHIPSRGE